MNHELSKAKRPTPTKPQKPIQKPVTKKSTEPIVVEPNALVGTKWFAGQIGFERWEMFIKNIKKHHGTDKVILGCESQGKGVFVYLYGPPRKRLGSFGDVEIQLRELNENSVSSKSKNKRK